MEVGWRKSETQQQCEVCLPGESCGWRGGWTVELAPLRQRNICLWLDKQELLDFGACRPLEIDAAVFAAVSVDCPQQPTPGNQGRGQAWGFHKVSAGSLK